MGLANNYPKEPKNERLYNLYKSDYTEGLTYQQWLQNRVVLLEIERDFYKQLAINRGYNIKT